MRIVRRVLGVTAALGLGAEFMRGAYQNRDYYGTAVDAFDVVAALVVMLPFLLLALTPRRRQSKRQELVELVGLVVAIGVMACAWSYADTSLRSTAGLVVLWTLVATMAWFGIVTWLRERDFRRTTPVRSDRAS